MKFLLYFFLLLFISNCSSNKISYWCGDHPCNNKKEKEEYFKKTMIVEVKYSDINNNKKDSKIDQILNQAQNNSLDNKEAKTSKIDKLIEKKTKQKKEKLLAKQLKREEKKRLKEEKILAKLIEKEERKRIKEEKANLKIENKLPKQTKTKENKESNIEAKNIVEKTVAEVNVVQKLPKNDISVINSLDAKRTEYTSFDQIVKNIIENSHEKSYPDINNVDY